MTTVEQLNLAAPELRDSPNCSAQRNTRKWLALSRNRQRSRLKPNSLEKVVCPFQAVYPFLEEKGRMKCALLQAPRQSSCRSHGLTWNTLFCSLIFRYFSSSGWR